VTADGGDAPIQHLERDEGGEFTIDGGGAGSRGRLTYRRAPDRITILHTIVDPALEGRGIGRRLVAEAVAWARAAGLEVAATCTFARRVLDAPPEHHDVRA
jgi:hypothetical protein